MSGTRRAQVTATTDFLAPNIFDKAVACTLHFARAPEDPDDHPGRVALVRRSPLFARIIIAAHRHRVAELEHRRDRHSEDYRDKERELMRRLNLVGEFWSISSMLDASAETCHPPGYGSFMDWHTCCAVRNELLAAFAREAIDLR